MPFSISSLSTGLASPSRLNDSAIESPHHRKLLTGPRDSRVWPHLTVAWLALTLFPLAVPVVSPTQLGFFGLASNLPIPALTLLALPLIGFAVAVVAGSRSIVLGTYVAVAGTMLHGLDVLAYLYPRGPWAWKHAGMVEYIITHQGVDRVGDYGAMTIYHSWPGFFGLNAAVSEAAGLSNPISYIAWAPIFFNLLYIALVATIFRSLTSDERVVWTGAMVFTVANWIGQDYFSPQAIAYVLMLFIVALALRSSPGRGENALGSRGGRGLTFVLVVVALIAVSVVHQLTPVMTVLITGGLVFLKATRLRWLPFALVGISLAWILSYAFPYTQEALIDRVVGDIVNLGDRFDRTLVSYDQVDASQRAISLIARTLVFILGSGAAIGLYRGFRRLLSTKWALTMAAAPFLMILVSAYANEVTFRAYFFALPGLAFLVALMWFADSRESPTLLTGVSLSVFLICLASLSIFANYGNDVRTTFTADEVDTASYMYENAEPGSLVIQLDLLTPTKFHKFENLAELPLDSVSETAEARVLGDPAGVLAAWGRDGGYSEVYVFLTRGQAESIARMGTMPAESFEIVSRGLRGSPEWELLIDKTHASLFRLKKS